MKLAILMLLLITLVYSFSSFAATITVGPSGQDYPTIHEALIAAEYGDEVVVYPGTYQEQVTMKDGVTLKSYDQGTDGYNDYFYKSGVTVIDGNGSFPVVELANDSRLEGFTITGGSSSGFAVHGYFETVEVVGNRIINNAGGGLYLLGDGIIHKNLIAENGGIGLELVYSSAFVHYNSIASNSNDGIRAYESSADIQDNIVAGNGQTGMGTAGIRCSGSALPTLDYNDVWNNLDDNYVGCSAGPNSISQDPLWDSNYRINEMSPCFDAGTDQGDEYPYWSSDFDMGWFEYVLPPLPSMSIWGIFIALFLIGGVMKMRRKAVLSIAILLALSIPATFAQSTMLTMASGNNQSGVPTKDLEEPLVARLVYTTEVEPTNDAFVDQRWPDQNLNGTDLNFGRRIVVTQPREAYTYLKFNNPSYPYNVLGGTLRLYVYDTYPSSTLLHGWMFNVTEDWYETSVTWNTRPDWYEINPGEDFTIVDDQYNYYDLPSGLVQDWFSASPSSYGLGLWAVGTGYDYYAWCYSSEYVGDPQKRPKLLIATDDPLSGVPGENVVFEWSTTQYGSYTLLDNVTTDSEGNASWIGPLPNYEGDIWVRATCANADFGSPVYFQVYLEKPVITGTVTIGEYPGETPVGSGEDVIVINLVEDFYFTVQTNVEGVYTTADDPTILPLGTYYVVALVDDCQESMETVVVSEPRTYERDIQVVCAMIHGKVRSPTGPVSGATITLNPGGLTRETTTEGDYYFALNPGTFPASYTVTAEKSSIYAYPNPEYVTLTADNPVGVANFCWISTNKDRGHPGDDYVYYPEHFSTPGFDANHVNLAGMPEESIDTFTGKVNLTYTDLHLSGKGGLDVNVLRTYSSCIKERTPWGDDNIFTQKFIPETCLGLGWDIHFGKILNMDSDTPVIVMPDGSRHVAYEVPHSGSQGGYPKYTSDLWKLEKINVSGLAYDLLLTTTSGIKYYFDRSDFYTETNLVECWQKDCAAVSEIRSADADGVSGNRISIAYGVEGGRMVVDNVTDTYSRVVEFDYASGFLTQIRGPNNSVYIEYSVTEFGYGRNALDTVIARANGTGGDPGDMSTAYSYDGDIASPAFGVLTDILLPTGGTITYAHEEHEFHLKAFDGSNIYDRTYADISIVSRTADGSDVTAGTTTYSIATYGPLDQYTVVNDPLGNDTQYRYWNYYSTDLGDIAEWKIGLSAEIIYYDGLVSGGSPVKTETKTYESRRLSRWRKLNNDREYVHFPVITQTDTILHGTTKGGRISQLIKTVSQEPGHNQNLYSSQVPLLKQQESRGQVSSKIEYIYPGADGDLADLENYVALGMPGNVIEYNYSDTAERTTSYIYVWESACSGYSNFRTANFLSGVYQEEIIEGNTGGTVKSRTRSEYFSSLGDPKFTRLQSVNQWTDPSTGSPDIIVGYAYYTSAGDAGNLYTITDAQAKVTTFAWNAGTISQITTPQQLPDSSYMTFSQGVDPDTGRVTSITDPNGNTTNYVYDDLGHLIQITPPSDLQTALTYDVTGGQVTSTQGSYSITYNYDALGRLKQTIIPSDQAGPSYINQEYDAVGNPNFISEASFSSSSTDGMYYTYGPLNRLIDVTDPDGTTTYSYDGNEVTITRGTQTTVKLYDALGRLDQITDADSKLFDYGYDVLDNLTLVDHPNDVTCSDRTFIYDGLGRLTSETHPETGTVTYTYYNSGQVETISKASGRVISFTYDEIYRLTSKNAGSGADQIKVDYYYDGDDILNFTGDDAPGFYVEAFNHRTGAVVRKGVSLNEESILVWPEFDVQGRNLLKDVNLASPALTASYYFGYDTLGNLNNIVYPSGIDVSYTYGAGTNLLETISLTGSSGTQTMANGLLHNPAGGLEEYVFGNGVVTTISHDVRNRPSSWVTQIGVDDLVNDSFAYDAFGNITELGTTTFTYDNLNRIETATGLGSRNFTYSYDSVGNILSVAKTNPSDTSSFTYSNNKIASVTHDADGNMTDDSIYLYTYDELGKLIDTDSTVQYRYDGIDKRIYKAEGSNTFIYSYLGELLLSEFDTSAMLFIDNIYLGGELLVRVTDDGATTTIIFAHLNHLGSPMAFTNDVATIVWPEQTGGLPYEVHNYEPFGADFDDLGSPVFSAQDIRYTGKLFESTTQKHYFNARYLNAITEQTNYELPPRFLSPDAIKGYLENPQSWNRYTFCQNNPVNFTDPNGLEIFFRGPHSKALEGMVLSLENASPTVKSTLAKYRGTQNPDLTITSGQNLVDPTGIPAEGTHKARISPAMKLDSTGTKVTDTINPDLTVLYGVTITVEDVLVTRNKKLAGVLIHEIGHAEDAISNLGTAAQEAYDYTVLKKQYEPHNKRPEEIRNIPYIKKVLQEVKLYDKRQRRTNRLSPTKELP